MRRGAGAFCNSFTVDIGGVHDARVKKRRSKRAGTERAFDYDAADGSSRRRQTTSKLKHEDAIANENQRKILSSNAQDLVRNFVIAKWAIGKHLDYVSRFCFKSNTGDAGLDAELDQYMCLRTTRERFDAARRHPLRRSLRLTEASRCVNGDIGWMRLAPGGFPLSALDGAIQMIESDLIRTPPNSKDGDRWMNGVLTDIVGGAEAYGLHTRNGSGYDFVRNVPADSMFLHAWYDFRIDQTRGISPVASALNSFRDSYESLEYAFAKLKVAQLFGIQVTRNGEFSPLGDPTATKSTHTNSAGAPDSDYEVELGKGPFMLDMNPGDEMKVVESATPSTQTVDFLKLMIHTAIRSLDIPFSFFDESFTNFYGSRGALNQYLKSCKTKISDLQDLLYWWTDWAFAVAVLRGEITLPSGMDLEDIDYEWTPEGVPWWDSIKEVTGAKMAISGGLSSPQRACREADTDFKRNIDETAEAMAYAKSKGVPLDYGINPALLQLLADDPAQSAEPKPKPQGQPQ